MKAGKITAKIRDAVKVRLMEDGKEKMMYRNIDLPEAIKDLEIRDFAFDVHLDGKIDFMLHFDKGILPEVFPAIREKGSRKPKAPETTAPKAPETTAPSALRIPIATAPSSPQPPTMAATAGNTAQAPKLALPAPTPAPKPHDAAPEQKPAEKNDTKPEARPIAPVKPVTATDKPKASEQQKK